MASLVALKKACLRNPHTRASFCQAGPGWALTYLAHGPLSMSTSRAEGEARPGVLGRAWLVETSAHGRKGGQNTAGGRARLVSRRRLLLAA